MATFTDISKLILSLKMRGEGTIMQNSKNRRLELSYWANRMLTELFVVTPMEQFFACKAIYGNKKAQQLR
jgi:hypothetical protein